VHALELAHVVDDRRNADRIGPAQRSAAPHGKTVAVDPDDVDVARPGGDPLVELLRRLVHQRIQTALEDLVVGHRAPRDAVFARDALGDLVDRRIRDRRAIAGLVAVVARARLLAETSELAQRVGDARVPPLRR
jgi:hypothetical protein